MFGTNTATVRPSMVSACLTTSAASANCGISFAGTNEQTSISRTPARNSSLHHRILSSVGTNVGTLCSPSRVPTSWTNTSVIARSFPCSLSVQLSRKVFALNKLENEASLLSRELGACLGGERFYAFDSVFGNHRAVIGLQLKGEPGLQV